MKIVRNQHRVRVDLEGTVSFDTVQNIKEEVFKLLEDGDRVVIFDLSNVTFMDSAGLGMLISFVKRMNSRDGKVIVEHPQMGVQKLLEMTRMDQLLEMKKTTETTTGSWGAFT